MRSGVKISILTSKIEDTKFGTVRAVFLPLQISKELLSNGVADIIS